MGLSVFIITLNEKEFIRSCLESVRFADEVIVVDSGSNDGTKSIINEFPNTKLLEQSWLGYSKQKQFALDHCRNEWCLNLDADERIDNEAQDFMRKISNSSTTLDGYYMHRWDKFLGKYPPSLMKKESSLRFFRKRSGSIKKVDVHEIIVLDNPSNYGWMPGRLIHDGYDSPQIYKKKFSHYAQLRAQASTKKFSFLEFLFIIPFETIKQLFLKRKIFWGHRGLYLSYLHVWYAAIKRVKLIKNGVTL